MKILKANEIKCELFHDNFQNFKQYNIPKAQLVLCDIPYNVGLDFYASRPDWYVDGDNTNGTSEKAGKAAFNSDFKFNIAEFFHFCTRLLKKEPEKGEKDAPCMIIFCAFQQIPEVIKQAEKYGFKKYIPLVFCKNYSPQVLKANMKIVGATEYALVLYRNKLPKSIAAQEHAKAEIVNQTMVAKAEADKKAAILKAESDAEKIRIAAEAQAKANALISESISKELIELRKIEAWDGKLPNVMGTGSGTLFGIDVKD